MKQVFKVGLIRLALVTLSTLSLRAAPTIGTTALTPTSIPVGAPTVITVTSLITDTTLIATSVNLQRLDDSGAATAVLGILHDDALNGDAVANDGIFTLQVTLNEPATGPVSLRVSASFRGILSRLFSNVLTVNVAAPGPAPAPKITITSPANLSYLNLSPFTFNGTVDDPTASVTINSIAAPVANGRFSVMLPLAEGPNIVTATAKSASGTAGTASIQVTLDTTPPHVTITTPPDKFVTTDATVSIAGNVNDIVVGTVNDQQAQVTINGSPAQVANRTFLASNIPLNLGDNIISAIARDRAGNAATTQITITRNPPTQSAQIKLISGNSQTGTIGSLLSAPLVIALVDGTGNPLPNKPVVFKVANNNGVLSGVPAGGGAPAQVLMATTDAQGQARAQWTLGARSGAGGNTVEAYSVGIDGTAIFNATGTQGPPGIIVIDSGNNQIGAVGQAIPKPLIAVIVDSGSNRLPNVPLTFTVKQGGGSFSGQTTLNAISDSDGRVAATLTLGLQEGNSNNLIEANFATNQGFPASFTASGRAQGDPAKTTISGVVLDNSNTPIPGVAVRAALTNVMNSNSSAAQTAAAAQTDAKGQFTIAPAPVGFVKLLVDGSTATRPGPYPTLDYDLVTVAGQDNTVGQPIFLLPIKTNNQLCVSGATGGGTLTIPEAPGFSLTFGPGQVTFPGGSKDGCISVTVVHPDKVPMTPGFGQQPRFIVTIQPSGALFNPPAPITLPNVDGLLPRAVTEMYSFDHDIGSFVAIGTGVVSDDGQVIRSSQGVGVLKAGWHCGGNPSAAGAAASCGPCAFCDGNNCKPDQKRLNNACQNPCLQNGAGTCSASGLCSGNNLQNGTKCNTFGGSCQNGQCVGGQCPGGCNSSNACIVDGCANGQCTTAPSAACQSACTGLGFGAPCSIPFLAGGGLSGTCDASGYCQVCGSLPVGTSCVLAGQVTGVCYPGGQCRPSPPRQCSGGAGCGACQVCQGTTCVPGPDTATCCGGFAFDPSSEGCFNPPNNPVDLIYDKGSTCDVELVSPPLGYLVPKNVTGNDPFQLWCPQRIQNQAKHLFDGCSIPYAAAVAGGFFAQKLFPHYTGDINEPIAGVRFSNTLSGQTNGACDVHDSCYQKCYPNPAGPPSNSNRADCDASLLQVASKACDDALLKFSPLWVECQNVAKAYYDGLRLLGGSAFVDDQKKYCQCCQ